MKRVFKLVLRKRDERHQDVDFIFNPKDLPDLKPGDVVQISSVDEEHEVVKLLLQVTKLLDDCIARNNVSIDSALTSTFPFKALGGVHVKKINAKDVALDLVELTFREQYISRADMCRLRRYLLNRCVCLNGKLEFCMIRLNVNELWRKGECVTCGYVDENTRVVFRSSSALVFIFIQMSTEMWDFDTQGNCYYEKCVDGFLPELFKRWREKKCSHYVTIVVFSRWFYSAKSLDEFPAPCRSRLQKDYRGRFYHDYYHVLVQNEHYDDWMETIPKIKVAFHQYNQSIKDHLNKNKMPPAENSTAANGNVIETLNLSFNVFATHYVDRTFERTGQMVVLVTPGGGVFNVDRSFANMTKQRNFDYGIAVDLVCLGEQPLHAVPLLIYHSKATAEGKPPEIEDYFIMHWVNYSYYNPTMYPNPICNFRPRVKLPDSMLEGEETPIFAPPHFGIVSSPLITYPDFDAFDAAVFSNHAAKKRPHKSSVPYVGRFARPLMIRQSSDEDLLARRSIESSSQPIEIPSAFAERNIVGSAIQPRGFFSPPVKTTFDVVERFRVGSAEGQTMVKKTMIGNFMEPEEVRRPLINPFKPSEFSVRITSNRRRWIHVFPVDSRGLSKQAHHSVAGTSIFYANLEDSDPTQVPEAPLVAIDTDNNSAEIVVTRQKSPEKLFTLKETGPSGTATKGKTLIWAWGCTGEEQWNPDIEVGTDWKSMILPACLPITTDFFPDARSLKNDYLFSEHNILLDEMAKDVWRTSSSSGDYRLDIFNELVAQRLQQGFQIVLLPLDMLHSAIAIGCGRTSVPEKGCYMSISRIYHRLSLEGPCIYVTKFTPRHPYPLRSFTCSYECQVPDADTYETTTTTFEHDGLEKLNWSFVDNLVVSQGEGEDYMFQKDMKFWQCRFVLLPSSHPATVKIIGGQEAHCDIYMSTEAPDFKPMKILDSFLKFMETLNKIRRLTNLMRVFQGVEKNPDLSATDIPKLVGAVSGAKGLNFFSHKGAEKLFVSVELVRWLVGYVPDVDDVAAAVDICQRLLDQNLIRHVSGEKTFVYGFYIYYFVVPNVKEPSDTTFFEAAVVDTSCTSKTPRNTCLYRTNTFKLDFDSTKKSERVEWGQLRINKGFCLNSVFEVNVEWLVATGSIVNDTIMQLHRKSLSFHPLCLLPVPLDPFALPHNPFSDPLRNPVSVSLKGDVVARLSDEQLERFHVELLTKFGFIPLTCEVHTGKQYIHMSAGMCAMPDKRAGYLWAWNATLGHRFRSPSTTGDEAFQDKMLADFRAFCSNCDNRLQQFIDESFYV